MSFKVTVQSDTSDVVLSCTRGTTLQMYCTSPRRSAYEQARQCTTNVISDCSWRSSMASRGRRRATHSVVVRERVVLRVQSNHGDIDDLARAARTLKASRRHAHGRRLEWRRVIPLRYGRGIECDVEHEAHHDRVDGVVATRITLQMCKVRCGGLIGTCHVSSASSRCWRSSTSSPSRSGMP